MTLEFLWLVILSEAKNRRRFFASLRMTKEGVILGRPPSMKAPAPGIPLGGLSQFDQFLELREKK
jgi:hypothetical protein